MPHTPRALSATPVLAATPNAACRHPPTTDDGADHPVATTLPAATPRRATTAPTAASPPRCLPPPPAGRRRRRPPRRHLFDRVSCPPMALVTFGPAQNRRLRGEYVYSQG